MGTASARKAAHGERRDKSIRARFAALRLNEIGTPKDISMNSIRTAVLAGLGFVIASLTPALAATSALVTATVSERAGPDTYYPVVAVIPAGAAVTIYGCLSDVSWCDVSYAGERGWVEGAYLQAYYQQAPVAVPYYAPEIGIPFIVFEIDIYWNNYYRHRPFFRERPRFERLAGRHRNVGRVVGVPTGVAVPGHKGRRVITYPVSPQSLAYVQAAKHGRLVKTGPGPHPQVFVMGPHPQVSVTRLGKPFRYVQGPPARNFAAIRPVMPSYAPSRPIGPRIIIPTRPAGPRCTNKRFCG